MKKSIRADAVLETLPEATQRLLTRVARTAEKRSSTLHLVGGPVRDLLLGRPLVDLDLMVETNAAELAEAVAAEAPENSLKLTQHPRFGTVRIESEDAAIDLATLRSERYAHPGALPEVGEGTLDEDIQRRDFSVNALVCPLDFSQPTKGREIIDRCGGLVDLADRKLRVLHDRSFHDDPTRAWRAARFGARLSFSLERHSRSVLRDALRDGAVGAVSGERFRRELITTFSEATSQGTHPGRVLRLLSDWHVLAALEPGLTLPKDRMSPLRKLGRAAAEPDWATPRWRPWVSGLAIWLAPQPAALRRRTLERFSIRGEQAKWITGFGREGERVLRALTRARGRGAIDAALADHSEESVQALYSLAEPSLRRRILRWAAEDRRRRAPVTGSDLQNAGLAGPEIGKALARIRAGFLDAEIANREEALALAQEIVRRARPKPKAKPRKTAKARARKPRKPASRAPKVAPETPIPDTPKPRGRGEQTR